MANQDPERQRKKAVGEPYEGKLHVWFEVAGDGNQDKVKALRRSQRKQRETGLRRLTLRRHSLTLHAGRDQRGFSASLQLPWVPP